MKIKTFTIVKKIGERLLCADGGFTDTVLWRSGRYRITEFKISDRNIIVFVILIIRCSYLYDGLSSQVQHLV